MDTQSYKQSTSPDSFINLVFGLQIYIDDERLRVPNSLQRALNELAFALRKDFPKTLHSFIALCHQPILDWYPYPHPDFNPSQPILYDGQLSEEAQEFCFTLTEQLQLPKNPHRDIPQAALDNRKMIELRHRLKKSPDPDAAQALYQRVRSFLIEHSWASLEQLREQPREIFRELSEFYVEIPQLPVDNLIFCERCGLLEWKAGRWHGIKPSYCSDHGSGSPYIRTIPNSGQLWRLTRGIHLRTFLPGRLELALFTIADDLLDEYPDYLLSVERYPGFDTYDLRLTFSDGVVWAIDAKDQAQPDRLALAIQLPYGEGALAYTEVFYVIPDRRMNEWGYREALENAMGSRPANLHIASLSEFQQHIEEKLKSLAKSHRRKKGN